MNTKLSCDKKGSEECRKMTLRGKHYKSTISTYIKKIHIVTKLTQVKNQKIYIKRGVTPQRDPDIPDQSVDTP